MAGSYEHAVTDEGKLRYYTFGELVENLGDAFETIEEMYGMIWYLAQKVADFDPARGLRDNHYPADWVETARKHWGDGIGFSPGIEDQ